MTANEIKKKLESQGFYITRVEEEDEGFYLNFILGFGMMTKDDLQRLVLLPNFEGLEANTAGEVVVVFRARKKGK